MTDPFHPLSVRDIPLLTRYFARQDTRLCNASAGAAVLWQPYFQDAALEVDGMLLLREQFPGLGTVFSTPIGENVGNAYDFLVKYCRAVGQPVQFFPATAADVENLRARFGDVEVTPVRDWFDYLYDAQDMVTFRGRRFNGQRNHIHHFQRLYPDWAFERVTEENLPEGLTMLPLPGHFFDMCGFGTADGVWFLADCLTSETVIEKYHVQFLYDVAGYLDTLDKVSRLEGRLFIPAHAEATEDIRPLAEKNRQKVLEILDVVRSLCREPRMFEEILQGLFAHYQLTMDFSQYVLVGSTLRSYLAYLLDNGGAEAEFMDNRLLWRAV